MTMVGKTLVGLTAVALMAAGPAFAGPEVQDELAEMRELVEGLKKQVDAQEEQIQHQSELLEDAQKVVRETQLEKGALSGLSEFWQAIDVNMSVAGSYAWNFANPDNGGPFPSAGANSGALAIYPFHGDHNSFQVDQVWLDIGKEATAESRAGFQFTALYGNTAAFLGQTGNVASNVSTDLDGDGVPDIGLSGGGTSFLVSSSRRANGNSASDFYLHQAYVNWLAPVPIGDGVNVTLGKFATLIGAETADAAANWNITRGNVYQLFQPIDHTGVLVGSNLGPVTFAGAVVNSGHLSNGAPDLNQEKTYIGQVGFSMDQVSTAVSVLFGADGVTAAPNFAPTAGHNGQQYGLVDVVAKYDAEAFQAWLNADYVWVEGSSAQGWGIALAGRVPITELFSTAVRLEYARDWASKTGAGVAPAGLFGFGGPRHTDVYSATGTLAYELAQNLTLKGEIRWDRAIETQGGGSDAFTSRTASGNDSQVVGLAQMVYAF